MTVEEALAISDNARDYTHNEQVIARLTLAAEVRVHQAWAAGVINRGHDVLNGSGWGEGAVDAARFILGWGADS